MWNELFKMQKELDKQIHIEKGLTYEETFTRRVLALLVEVGEFANEWQGFKYWKENNEPRTEHECEVCEGEGSILIDEESINDGKGVRVAYIECQYCNGEGYLDKNPLLEEYVDNLHFILSLGNDLGINELQYTDMTVQKDLTGQFIDLYNMISLLQEEGYQKRMYHAVFSQFIRIGQQLGFTTEQVVEAYKSKNEVNFQRLQEGY